MTSDKKITDRTRNGLLELKNKSYIIVGVTARNLQSVKNILDVNLFDYIILNNGLDIFEHDKIENAGIGVAMNNAIDVVKQKASFVTLSNDDGIAEYLEKICKVKIPAY